MDDLISRQAAIDIERNATVDTNPSHFEAHQKFTQFMDDVEISSFGRWQWSNGFNTALTAVGIDLKSCHPYSLRGSGDGGCQSQRAIVADMTLSLRDMSILLSDMSVLSVVMGKKKK